MDHTKSLDLGSGDFHALYINEGEPTRQSKEEIERECNFEWLGLSLDCRLSIFMGI